MSQSGLSIHRAVEQGAYEEVKRLLAESPHLANFERPGEPDRPLHFAAWQGHRDIAELLLKCGGEVNAKGDCGMTPLHYSAKHGTPSVAELLLKNGADVEATDNSGFTPLFQASRGGSDECDEVARLLLEHGAVIDLNAAMCLGRIDLVRSFLASPDAVKNSRFPEYLLEDAVILARLGIGRQREPDANLAAEYIDLIERLLAQQPPKESCYRALHTAIQDAIPEIVEALLTYGASALEPWQSDSLQDLASCQQGTVGRKIRDAVNRHLASRTGQEGDY